MNKTRKFTIITLFPEIIKPALETSMMWKATEENLAIFEFINLRDFGIGVHKKVDDTPYGGGDGMLLMIEPLFNALQQAKKQNPNSKVILMSPSKIEWSQKLAYEFANSNDNYIFICGRYEGFDARIEDFIDAKISIGKFVLTGGELPAAVIIDSIVRLIPGVLGGENSAEIESYSNGDNLEFPQYTRPEIWQDKKVPEVLLSGHHAEILKWREKNSK